MLLISLLVVGLGTLTVIGVGAAMFVSVAFSPDALRQVAVEVPAETEAAYGPVSTCDFATPDLSSRRALRNTRDAQAAL